MKRLFDLAVVLAALPLWLPVLAVLAVLVAVRLGRPVFFRQLRPGYRAVPFHLRKFRSMTDARDEAGKLLPDADRLPPFGRWLRSTSLDELPELFHVLSGKMSLVGPRPLLMQYLPLYSPRQALRHNVRPGLTGWSQVNGRNALTWEQKLEMDAWYAENQSFLLDLRILAMTFAKVLRADGVTAPGSATTPFFTGNNPAEKPS
jgi:sugar transferase EpsL